MEKRRLPFEGIRVCDFSWFAAGPVATKTLADHGAEVIKMESASHPDGIRIASPLTPGKEEESMNVGGWFNNMNSSKLCLGLNLAHPRAKEVYDRLIMARPVLIPLEVLVSMGATNPFSRGTLVGTPATPTLPP